MSLTDIILDSVGAKPLYRLSHLAKHAEKLPAEPKVTLLDPESGEQRSLPVILNRLYPLAYHVLFAKTLGVIVGGSAFLSTSPQAHWTDAFIALAVLGMGSYAWYRGHLASQIFDEKIDDLTIQIDERLREVRVHDIAQYR